MIGSCLSAVFQGVTQGARAKRFRPIYADIIEAAARREYGPKEPQPENYDRTVRTDFWNDPDRWEGIDDPHKTMCWEVRRRDVIDVRPSPKPLPNPYQNTGMDCFRGHYPHAPLRVYASG